MLIQKDLKSLPRTPSKPKQIDVRVIAATNKNIEDMVASKKFREDLYYRLNVVPIYIPPLRERRDDILPLIFHFLEKFSKAQHKKKSVSPEAIDALCTYDFPGNIRELANIIERLVVITDKDRIEAVDLPNAILDHSLAGLRFSFLPEDLPLKDAMERYANSMIEKAIKKYGSQREAAKALRVNQATLSRRMKKSSTAKADA